ncbi:MAG: NAD-dependent epimerase/dehydratase family protein [Anaerolineae bacterium]|nr:NAD-dependent epimerase/dehydratase family protein [Anaerolineae bacterium]
MSERVLVTGGSGFIGSHLVEALLGRGDEVHCLLLPGDAAANLNAVRGDVCIHDADLTDRDALERIVRAVRPQLVFHLAAVGVADVNLDPALVARVNIEGTLNLLQALKGEYRVLINTGTCHEYGNQPPLLHEDLAPRPELPYAIAKTAAWHFCNRFVKTEGWPIVTVRPFSVYGPRQAPNTFVQACIRTAREGRDFEMTAGEQRRDWVYVADIVKGFVRAATAPEAAGETFNLCSGQGTPLYRVAEMIFEAVGSTAAIQRGALPYRDGEIWELVGDPARAREVLGWQATTSLPEGIAKTVRAPAKGI